MSMHQDNMPPLQDPAFKELMELFNEKSYWQRMKHMCYGLKQPKESGDYKLARTELQRQWAPFTAVVLPSLCVLLLAIFANAKMGSDRSFETEIVDPEEVKELEEIVEPEKPPEEIQPTDVKFDPDISVQTQVQDAPMSPQPQTFDAVLQVKSPVILRNIFGPTRNAGMRGTLLGKGGGNAATEAAVMRALRWLKKNQRPDGSWPRAKDAMTGLAILCFLAHDERPGVSREFGETVQRAIEYLMGAQKANGEWPGGYQHPIATYAICEAFGMTQNPSVKEAAEKGVALIIANQHVTGGWNYFNAPAADRDDTSVMGWAAQALKAAQMANFYGDPAALEAACKNSVKGFIKNSRPSGGFGYTGPGATGLSAVGTLCMQFHGAGNRPEVVNTLAFMDPWMPVWNGSRPGARLDGGAKPAVQGNVPGGNVQYYYYYATQAKFQAGGKRWTSWNEVMWPEYIKAQFIEEKAIADPDGVMQDIGWWENSDGSTDRPVMDTCLAALQLMVYYRYLPTFKTVEVETEVAATATDNDDIKVNIGNL
jgi:hypothetical protein